MNDFVRNMDDNELRYYYDVFEEYMQSGVLRNDEVRRTLESYYGSRYAINIMFAATIVYREVARRHYDPSQQPF